ncbi:nucleoside 2-deoxyribosyltransferase [Aquimarina megaterium]|uniref:nucleoside 2-deoxyribosyltransferase n=1 Tax=Aquimarina megaterium TaxID=1443666 RepID=UPI00047026FA|nr:nucleoside 2-deoxyribosyltransferase [Aquimarina megaterium]
MKSEICILGDIVTDITLPQNGDEIKIRFGGITHSARSLWAINTDYDVKFFAPSYLFKEIYKFCNHHGVKETLPLGIINGAPYTFLIGSVKETGNQLYDFILRDQIEIEYNTENFKSLKGYKEILITSGNFNLGLILKEIDENCNVHIDLSNNISSFSQLDGYYFKTIFLSTSSDLFLSNYNDSFEQFYSLFKGRCGVLVLKENRGGSRIYDFDNEKKYQIPSITQPIVHSVGIGDAYNACYIANYQKLGINNAAFLSSWIACEYASTTYPDDFKKNISRVLKTKIEDIISMGGCVLPWEKRQLFPIYIAAPDFDYLDTSQIEILVESLQYHNFCPRRPVKENGQLSIKNTKEERINTYNNDIELIKKCKLLIVVYINDDPGTMIELGYAKALGIPCLVFDPYNRAYNCMLTEMPEIVSSDLDVIISEVFNELSKLNE